MIVLDTKKKFSINAASCKYSACLPTFTDIFLFAIGRYADEPFPDRSDDEIAIPVTVKGAYHCAFASCQQFIVFILYDLSVFIIADPSADTMEPDPSERIFRQAQYGIVDQPFIRSKVLESVAVEPAYAAIGCDPDKSLAILDHIVHLGAG